MFWPYLPRQGYPATPAWLMVILLIVAAVLTVAILSLIEHFTHPFF